MHEESVADDVEERVLLFGIDFISGAVDSKSGGNYPTTTWCLLLIDILIIRAQTGTVNLDRMTASQIGRSPASTFELQALGTMAAARPGMAVP